ncbi:MAG TPA: glycosyltransferase, partial [Acidobacteriaceae bacterium]|nr:glycosyltransferase [Acidobacteriaceae bacterium]
CGFSPPTRLFEVAGAGACMLCDDWPGIDDCFEPKKEILVVRTAEEIVDALNHHGENSRKQIGEAFRTRALREHTYARRAEQAEQAILQICQRKMGPRREPAIEVIQEAA